MQYVNHQIDQLFPHMANAAFEDILKILTSIPATDPKQMVNT